MTSLFPMERLSGFQVQQGEYVAHFDIAFKFLPLRIVEKTLLIFPI